MFRLLIIIFISASVFSCVPNKKVTYLQGKNDNTGRKDTALSQYQMYLYEYKLKPGDVVSIRIGSITTKDYDFYQQYLDQLGPLLRTAVGTGNITQGNIGMGATQGNSKQLTGFKLDEQGYVYLPVMDSVNLSGLTLEQAEAKVQQVANGYFEHPSVRLNLLSFQFTVLGEVNTEGLITTYDPELNVLNGINLAGNMTEFADRSNVKIIRIENGKAKVAYVNLLDESFLTSPYFFLKPNDIIVVPPLKVRSFRKYAISNYTTALSVVSTTLLLIVTLTRTGL